MVPGNSKTQSIEEMAMVGNFAPENGETYRGMLQKSGAENLTYFRADDVI